MATEPQFPPSRSKTQASFAEIIRRMLLVGQRVPKTIEESALATPQPTQARIPPFEPGRQAELARQRFAHLPELSVPRGEEGLVEVAGTLREREARRIIAQPRPVGLPTGVADIPSNVRMGLWRLAARPQQMMDSLANLGQALAEPVDPGDPLTAAAFAFPPGALVFGSLRLTKIAKLLKTGRSVEAAALLETQFGKQALKTIGRAEQLMPDLQPVDDVVQAITNPDVVRRAVEKAAKIPVVGKAIGTFQPSAVASTPEQIYAITLARLAVEGEQKAAIAMSRLTALGSSAKVFGPEDAKGFLLRGPLKGKVLDDVVEGHTSGRELLAGDQKLWIDAASDLEDARLAIFKRNGIEINELTFEDGGRFAGRRWFGKMGADGEIAEFGFMATGPGRIGAKLPTEKARAFKTKEEALSEGFRAFPREETLWFNTAGAYRRIGQKKASDWFLERVAWRTTGAAEELVLASERATARLNTAQNSVKAIQRALRGEQLPAATVQAIRRIMPEVGARLGAATKLTLDDVLRSAEALQQPAVILPVPTPGTLKKLSRLLEEAAQAAAAQPSNAALLKNLSRLKRQLGFAKFRIAKGEPIELERRPIKEIVALRDTALRDLLDVVRGTPVAAKPGRFKGGLAEGFQKTAREASKKRTASRERAMRPSPYGRRPQVLKEETRIRLIQEGRLSPLGAPSAGEGQIAAPAFAGKVFDADVAQQINLFLNQRQNAVLAVINDANSIGRFFTLAGDASPLTIQLIFLAGQPIKMARAIEGFGKALLNPRYHANLIANNAALLQRNPNFLLAGVSPEITAAVGRGGVLNRAPLSFLGKPLKPFARAFESSLDTAGIEMLKSLERPNMTALQREQMNMFVNEFRGLASSKRLGISPVLQQVEATVLLAPRYNRAIASLLFDMFRGGIRGQEARIALARGITAIAAMSVAVSLAGGETLEEALKRLVPGSPGFMLWEVAGQQIGPGSKVRSVMNLLANTAEDPSKLLEEGMGNPAFRFARGNFAPVLRTGTDLLIGRRFMGDPSRDGLISLTETVLIQNLLPIYVQSMILEGGSIKGRLVRGAFEFIGFRAYPNSAFIAFAKHAENKALQVRLGIIGPDQDVVAYGDMNKLEKDMVKKGDSEGRRLWSLYLADKEMRGRDDEALTIMRAYVASRVEELDKVSENARETGAFGLLREAIQESGQDLASKIDGLRSIERYKEVFERFEDLPDDAQPVDIAHNAYMGIITNPELDDPIEGYDFAARDARLGELRNSIGDTLWKEVLEIRDLSRSQYSEEVQQWYRDSEDVLKPFWQVIDNLIGMSVVLRQQYNEWRRLGKVSRKSQRDYRNTRFFLDGMLDAASTKRELMRRLNPTLDATLVKWYPNYVPKNPLNQR